MGFKSKRVTRRPTAARADGQQRQSSILAAASVLFAEHGFDAVTTRQIARKARCNIASIKYYFGDKAGLYARVMEESIAKVLEGGTHFMPDPAADPRDALKSWIVWVLRTARRGTSQGQAHTKMMMQALLSGDALAARLSQHLGSPVSEGILTLIDRLFDHRLHPDLREHAFVFVFALCSRFAEAGPIHARMGISVPDDDTELEILAERLTNFVIGGLHSLSELSPKRGTTVSANSPTADASSTTEAPARTRARS